MQSVGLVISFSAVMLPLFLIGLVLLSGKGADLIAGFNTMPAEKREQYDAPRMSRFVGKVILFGWAIMMFIPLGIALGEMWLAAVAGGLFTAVIIAAVVYMNTGNRFKKL